MNVGPARSTNVALTQAQNAPVDKQQYQTAVLKKALEGQQQAADRLLKMLEPKGQVVDIRA